MARLPLLTGARIRRLKPFFRSYLSREGFGG